MDERERYEQGLAIRRQVLGDAHVDRTLAAQSPMTAEFQDLLTRYAWGEVWTRPSFDVRRMTEPCRLALDSLGTKEKEPNRRLGSKMWVPNRIRPIRRRRIAISKELPSRPAPALPFLRR